MNLVNYKTGEVIREATQAEIDASNAEIEAGHAEGVIEVGGVACYVE